MLQKMILATSLAITLQAAQAATEIAPETAPVTQPVLTLKVYNADANSFNVNSTLVMGAKDAILIDGGFTRADALRIAANVLDSGKQLTTIYVSQADPDYYFGVETLLNSGKKLPPFFVIQFALIYSFGVKPLKFFFQKAVVVPPSGFLEKFA